MYCKAEDQRGAVFWVNRVYLTRSFQGRQERLTNKEALCHNRLEAGEDHGPGVAGVDSLNLGSLKQW